jgi:putative intracellular protease/amidase
MEKLNDLQVAVLATDGVDESELIEPVAALREAGATVAIISPQAGHLTAFRHHDKSATIGVLILAAVGEPMRRLLARHPPLAKNQPVVN